MKRTAGLGHRRIGAPYAMHEIELAAPVAGLYLQDDVHGAHVLVRLRGRIVGRFWVHRARHGASLTVAEVRERIAATCRESAVERTVREALLAAHDPDPPPVPSLTVAVCTRNRAARLDGVLVALSALRAAAGSAAGRIDLLVVDNAPSDGTTREVIERWPGVRYVVESVPGLDFARNRALAEARTDLLAFIDDDATPDRHWLDALSEAARISPWAHAYTGPVLPAAVDTVAQVRFEIAGGFGEEIKFEISDARRWADPMHPANSGRLGTGTNMVFSTAALRAIGGFDEALDTGPPLPGGGDLDILSRVIRNGGRVVYSPAQVVHHEHRRDLASLRQQHASWGLSVMAFLSAYAGQAPEDRSKRLEFALWWWRHVAFRLACSLAGRYPHPPSVILAEAWGTLKGHFGEYARSKARVARRRTEAAR